MSRFDPKRFASLNFIGAAVWALVFGVLGYVFGQVVEVILEDVGKYELWIILGMVIIGGAVWLVRRYADKARDRRK